MNRVYLLIGAIAFLGGIYVIAPVVTDTYRRYRNRRTVICPETGQIAEVDLKAVRASLMSALGKHWVRVKGCSLWPRKKGCGQECMKYRPSESLRRTMRKSR